MYNVHKFSAAPFYAVVMNFGEVKAKGKRIENVSLSDICLSTIVNSRPIVIIHWLEICADLRWFLIKARQCVFYHLPNEGRVPEGKQETKQPIWCTWLYVVTQHNTSAHFLFISRANKCNINIKQRRNNKVERNLPRFILRPIVGSIYKGLKIWCDRAFNVTKLISPHMYIL
jgi:hypothetical protein